LLGGLFSQDMAQVRVRTLHFTITQEFEALFSATLGFHLWHFVLLELRLRVLRHAF
jgi:hypothetical protein